LVSHPRVHTVATRVQGAECEDTIPDGNVCYEVAQDKDYVAWMTNAPCTPLVFIQDLRTGRRTPIRTVPGNGCHLQGPLALVGSRVYWMDDNPGLWSASVRDPRRHFLAPGGQPGPGDGFWRNDLPLVTDGKRVYFWSSPGYGSAGPILSFRGVKRRRFGGWISSPAVLAAGGGRFARATYPSGRYDNASWPAWSPDGKEIAYMRGRFYCAWADPRGCGDNNVHPGLGQIWLVNADGTGRHLIAAHGITPAWSPDGTKLAYGAPHDEVVIANADGSDPQVVTSGFYPAWSPDGHELAVQDHGSIWVVSTDGTNRHRVLHNNAHAPAWSPDGSQLAFTHGLYDTLMVANADGSNAHSLGVQWVLRAVWSPDGSEIAYGRTVIVGSGYSSACIGLIRPDGTGKHCLHVTGSAAPISDIFWAGDPAWGPAPGQLVFSEHDNQADGDFHLVTWPDGRQITTASPEVISAYTNTGRKVAQTDAGGTLLALAVSKRVLAGLVRDPLGGWSVKIYQPRPRTIRLPGRPHAFLSASGMTLVFQIGRTIETLNAVHGSPQPVATTSTHAASISIFGRRIAWVDHNQIHTLNLP
jgi:hypothetical protein